MMKRMSFSETIFLFVLALIIFGPKKLPEIARQVGKYMNEFKRASNEFKAQIEQEISNLERRKAGSREANDSAARPPPQGATSRTPYAASLEAHTAEQLVRLDSVPESKFELLRPVPTTSRSLLQMQRRRRSCSIARRESSSRFLG